MTKLFAVVACVSGQMVFSAPAPQNPERPTADSDGTVHIPALSVPLSRYMSEEAQRKFIESTRAWPSKNPDWNGQPIAKLRADIESFSRSTVERAKLRYPVDIEERKIGGVRTHTVTPKEGVSRSNRHRVLINLHGGGFVVGGGLGGVTGAIPVAGVGKFKVISVDYRMAPEYAFPAASEDVTAVYSDLLKHYRPENIGIYGCSAGGILSAMTAAWLQKEKLPTPGAIGIFSAGAFGSSTGPPAAPNTWGGDSRFTTQPLIGYTPPPLKGVPAEALSGSLDYTANTDPNDPLVSPALSPQIMAKFPPTLLVTGTRAGDMSAAVQTQRELTKAGIRADLHLWDGMEHCFFMDTELPESQEAYAVIAKFFDTSLGRRQK